MGSANVSEKRKCAASATWSDEENWAQRSATWCFGCDAAGRGRSELRKPQTAGGGLMVREVSLMAALQRTWRGAECMHKCRWSCIALWVVERARVVEGQGDVVTSFVSAALWLRNKQQVVVGVSAPPRASATARAWADDGCFAGVAPGQ